MNRPFYALAALIATLTGSAVGIGPARCSSGVSRVAIDARAYCGMPSHTQGSQYFVHFKEGSLNEAYDDESYAYEDAIEEQGSDSVEQGSNSENLSPEIVRYEDSCGRDPLTGQIYVPVIDVASPTSNDGANANDVNYWSLFNNTPEPIASTNETETWPADERTELNDEAVENEAFAANDDIYREECPFLKNETVSPAAAPETAQNEIDYENIYTPNDYVEAQAALELDGEAERLAQEEYENEALHARLALKAWLATVTQAAADIAERVADNNALASNLPEANEFESTDESNYFPANEASEYEASDYEATEDLSAQLYEDAPLSTPALSTPAWVDEYFAPEVAQANDSEQVFDYASAELAAAQASQEAYYNASTQPETAPIAQPAVETEAVESEAVATEEEVAEYGPYGPALPLAEQTETIAPDYVDYDQEYQSNYELALLDAERDNESTGEATVAQDDDSESEDEEEGEFSNSAYRAILRAFGSIFFGIHEIVPDLDDEANLSFELLQQANAQVQMQWTDFASAAAAQAEMVTDTSEYEDYFDSADSDFASKENEIAAAGEDMEENFIPSTDWRDSIATGLRATGNLLLNIADELQSTYNSGNSVSARTTGTGSR